MEDIGRIASYKLKKWSCPQQALQHTRPWERDVPQVGAVRRQIFKTFVFRFYSLFSD